jgi:SAM-dependent methyltransferase
VTDQDVPDRLRRGQVFGSVADEYDRLRPTYPEQLVDDVLAYARLDGAPALEVGAGTGKATLAFAVRGVPVTALEPDPRMAEVLRRRAGAAPVTVMVGTFEEYVPERRFGLLYSAQAWHWVDPAVRWRKAAEALVPGGTVALFWNRDRPVDPAVTAEIRAALAHHAPAIWISDEMLPDQPEWPESTGLHDRTSRTYRWQRTMSTVDFVARLATVSSYVLLPSPTRAALFADILARLDDEIRLAVDTEFYLARTG